MSSTRQRRPGRDRPWIYAVCAGLLAASGSAVAQSAVAGMAPADLPLIVTNVLQLRQLALQDQPTSYAFDLDETIWWANPALGRFVLHDSSGTEEIEMASDSSSVKSGDRVRLTGNGIVARRGAAFRIGARGPVVNNDGVHSLIEMSGAIYLTAGTHPIRLDWFNGGGRFGLILEYEGPGIARQKIPDTAVRGVQYRCYEGDWKELPDFSRFTPVKSGSAANFDLSGRTRDLRVGMQFTGDLVVAKEGLYRFYLQSDDGARLFVGEPTLQLSVLGRTELPSPRPITIGQLLTGADAGGTWAQVEGKVIFASKQPSGLQLEVRAGAASMKVEIADDSGLPAGHWLNRRVRATGFCRGSFNLDGEKVAGVLLVPGVSEIQILDASTENAASGVMNSNSGTLPLLTSASAVRELGPQEARRGYPVRIQGVVTCVQPDRQAFVVQDSTMGLYVMNSSAGTLELPGVGEFLEIQGTTDEPGMARLKQLKRLGEGTLPEPIHPAWDQLMNGSLDSQWVEIGGLVESLIDRSNGWSRVMLRTRAGMLKVDLRKAGIKPGPIEQYENAVVRLRGCMFADWLPSLRLKVGQIRMFDVDVLVDQPAPADLFSVARTTAAALMRFDPAFDGSRRAKVGGQVVYVRGADYFIMDGSDGLRFMARQPLGFEAGDLVEAVGFPELSGAAPVLRGAVARKTGHAALPEAKHLAPEDLIRSSLDSTRVQIEGLLQNIKHTPTNLVLEMRSGPWRFLARLNQAASASSLQVGSRLQLTGVYCAQGGLAALGADVAPVDLLLNQLADIVVLARPSWWTLQRLLVILGLMAVALAATLLWITQLRRQVDERSAELAVQIQTREQIEHQHAMERERARIAQDLHDELGSDIATISMLAARAQFATAPDEKRNQYLGQMRGKAQEMVAALDEIVWAMNSGHDSLESVMSYLARYAERFLGLANITCRLEGPPDAANRQMDSVRRHQLFLAFREALTNVVRHSGATEVRLDLRVEGDELRLALADNGRGLVNGERNGETNGVANMRARIEKLHGRFEIGSEPAGGTVVRFAVPMNSAS